MSSLGKDLAAWRKAQNLTIEDIHELTKIPIHILESIEDDSIFSNILENNTYKRSFVRSYARALKIEDEAIIEALNQVEEKNYDGKLKPTEESPSKGPSFEFEESEEKREEKDKASEKQKDKGKVESASTSDSKKSSKSTPHKTPTSKTSKPASSKSKAKGKAKDSDKSDPRLIRDYSTPPPSSVSNINWAAIGKRFKPFQNTSRIWIIAFLLIIVIGIVSYFFFYENGSTQHEISGADSLAGVNQTVTNPDSLQLQLEPMDQPNSGIPSEQESEALAPLPDTLKVTVYAAYDKLEPVRIQSDVIQKMTPYWIEKGKGLRYEFMKYIKVRGQFSRMVLMYNGHPIPDFMNKFFVPDSDYVRINRSFFEENPRYREAVPDSLPEDIPPPNEIKDRPKF